MIHLFRKPALSEAQKNRLVENVKSFGFSITDIETELCFNIESSEPLTADENATLVWLLSETFEPENFSDKPFLTKGDIVEVGPRMNFQTAWSTNAISICNITGLSKIRRIEPSRRFRLISTEPLVHNDLIAFAVLVHDRMTECIYPQRLQTFETGIKPEAVKIVPLIEEGPDALRRINKEMGLGLDDWDIDYYYNLFVKDLKRNPTNVECFDLSQSNSEHSRHWFFQGKLVVDGAEVPQTLMQIVKAPYKANPLNSVIAFKDNSSAIEGFDIKSIKPERIGEPSRFVEFDAKYHPTLTAETHNFPTGVAPFPGAETGTGGRIRDVQAIGRGGLVIAGTAGYCVGNLHLPGKKQEWEDGTFVYPKNLAEPLEIEISASNGASDYGNKFGEPVIQGFTRSFGLRLPDGERREWLKPIMFTAGVGQMDGRHAEKFPPSKGMLVTKIGGPAYRIGMGGGAASSMIQGDNVAELDFNAVQRGDAEMEQKVNRVIRACVEMADRNPIVSIHDQGAGGNCNVLKEIIYPAGARIDVRKIQLGDATLSVLEIWGAEYQEQNAILIKAEDASLYKILASREKVPIAFLGEVTGDGIVVLYDSMDNSTPVNLSLDKVLGEMPQKTFTLDRIPSKLEALKLPDGLTVADALERVLRLLSVGSKRFLTNKVDRSVSGLIARQQCAGPLQLTVSDVAVVAQSHFGLTGTAIAIGEQPIKGLIDPAKMARMSVAEAITNIVWAKITGIEHIRCSGNWMWAPKLPGEGAKLYDAAIAMKDIMLTIGMAVDGGKDSLSMATRVKESDELVKSPGTLVISAYATMKDITKVVTPDLKSKNGKLMHIDIAGGSRRLGGSALAQVYEQVGNESPDIDDVANLKNAFKAVQELIDNGLILSGHDVSDGGIITTLLEMSFAGNRGININLESDIDDAISVLFAEEAGLVFEYEKEKEETIVSLLKTGGVSYKKIGESSADDTIKIAINGKSVLEDDMPRLREIWEETSYRLESLQSNPACADEERKNIKNRKGAEYSLSFTPQKSPAPSTRPKVAIIREEGSNGDREMTSAFYMAGFEPWDITMTDLISGKASLKDMRGVAFVGGFSYADVLDSAKGWAGGIKFNKKIYAEFEEFYHRADTFSLGVCNGCQLSALLGWVPWRGLDGLQQPRFIRNKSGRLESRFASIKIMQSPSIMLKGMEGSVLGAWVNHGEGLAYFPDKKIFNEANERHLFAVRYADDDGAVTEAYPFNPNGSPIGIAGICSPDGRHLAMMPHPERTFLKWQWGYMPEDWKGSLEVSPWLRMFQNARQWCG